ncbi:M23 family metallopeptidase [Corynebacterium guangdongense]|uniref:Murein DD-endopeptidase MepM/ murein hydrolase activator NlpD n=1 Tax=Corynebacterium guangdongense TaxID=1783348 RepID=A0ABU1ZX86_9CORY|nr:M23 family metallopeptidase [Corynebacterium guangdongense]MDR7329549.1 murein DD-endopeptidase MepM/ murein hydrolase activator NlpD [Corynebacterium guangdongense]WJZ18114.1 Peptidase family M23 [Corynebacterium guangdongense]
MIPVTIEFPVSGWWLARNSPARGVPSHGSHLLGTTYAVDLVGVESDGSSAPLSWRSAFWREEPEFFPGFGRAVTAPCEGLVVDVHDGEVDHAARRSQLTLAAYILGQGGRYRRGGVRAITGNTVSLRRRDGLVVSVCHLRRGSVAVQAGDWVRVGERLGECGNSGNSTQPHVHVQVTDGIDWENCRGLPMAFRRPRGTSWMPTENEVFEA